MPPRDSDSRLVIGYHATSLRNGLTILRTGKFGSVSDAPWNWLGTGTYFWVENPDRALEWGRTRVKGPAMIVKAAIRLGTCLNLDLARFHQPLQEMRRDLRQLLKQGGRSLPRNRGDLHDLDCAVIDHFCVQSGGFDTVRGTFRDGKPIFPGSAIYSLTHTQIAVRNPDCIVGPPKYEQAETPWR